MEYGFYTLKERRHPSDATKLLKFKMCSTTDIVSMIGWGELAQSERFEVSNRDTLGCV